MVCSCWRHHQHHHHCSHLRVIIDVGDLSEELANVPVFAQRSDTLCLGVVRRPETHIVTSDGAKVIFIWTMVALVSATTSICVAVTSTLFTILAVDEITVDGRIFRSCLHRQQRAKTRYQSPNRFRQLIVV